MYRLAVFRNGGVVEYDNAGNVPTSIFNELIVRECIESSRLATQAQLRLGKTGEYTARLARSPQHDINVALVFLASLKIEGADSVVADVTKIYASTGQINEKFRALVDVRLKNLVSVTEEPAKDKPLEMVEKKVRQRKSKGKKKRNWDGEASDSEGELLDYSEAQKAGVTNVDDVSASLNALDLGSKKKEGFVVKDLSNELGVILADDDGDSPQAEPFGFLKKFVGGKKLDDNDLKTVLLAMEDHLVRKNVAKEVAGAICDQVHKDLVGTSTSSWTSVKATVRQSIKQVLTQILTPSTSTDLLAGIHQKLKSARSPFVISLIGVNGVGKSTNLGKLAFWFLQNDFKVLVAACDTFRSGAVEQLKVHVQRLQQLKGSSGDIELYDQGYGKDAAVIAKHAVEHAAKNNFDIVLIDTAGRRHNDDRLMSSLEKFGKLANPDKIIMVGEALVGTDSVEQARNFDAAFGKGRGLDFFLISKCDTVGEMLGALVNVTHATGVPVLFVGVGQQYTDLRTLNVDWAVDKLLS